jgi:glycosyltransferase involved in cell wall biosynthesis
MIAHNEETKIGRALESVQFADEIIVVDCESSDRTAEIAADAGAILLTQPNLDNLNINKNYSFDQAQGEFILSIDADEVVTEKCGKDILDAVNSNPAQNGFFLPRCNFYFGRWLKHGAHYPDWQLRLFRREKGRFPGKHVHERLRIEGEIGKLRCAFHHFPYESYEEAERKLDFYTTFEARYLFEKGARPSLIKAFLNLYWRPLRRFLTRYLLKRGFLDGKPGYEAIKMDMRNFRTRYLKLRDMARNAR